MKGPSIRRVEKHCLRSRTPSHPEFILRSLLKYCRVQHCWFLCSLLERGRYEEIAVCAVIWWENTVLCVMLDVEAKQQVLNKGSKEKDLSSFRKGKRVRCHRRRVCVLLACRCPVETAVLSLPGQSRSSITSRFYSLQVCKS